MSSQESVNDNVGTEVKQFIGSSKRKRKSSIIKHNVVPSDIADLNETDGSSRPVRTYAKKIKAEKKKEVESMANEVPEAMNDSAEQEDSSPVDNSNSTSDANVEGWDVKTENEPKVEVLPAQPQDESESLVDDGRCMDKQQQCQNCNFCAEHKMNSAAEVKVEYALRRYTCKICAGIRLKRVYSSLESFKRHMKDVHEPKKDTKRFECTECPEPVWFPTKSKYCYHLGAKHPGIIKFVCEVCTQTFKLKANYKNHMKTHNIVVQKKFTCNVCGGTFVNRGGFESHKKRFPGPHIKQSCVHCGASFSKERYMKNHRCKVLLLEEAAAARDIKNFVINKVRDRGKEEKKTEPQQQVTTADKKVVKESTSETEPESKKQTGEVDPQSGKRVLLHRIMQKNDKLIYKQYPLQTQNAPQPVVVQEFREIDLEGGAFITTEPEQIIVRDVDGHLVQGNQILQLDLNDFQPGEESQVYLADWNVVAPIVIREKSP